MRVLVTGGTGFIGSKVVDLLLQRGHAVAVLSRSACRQARVRPIRGDLSAVRELAPALHEWRPEACVHLAWYAEPGKYLEAPVNTHFLAWSLELLRVLVSTGCRHFVIAGSCAEYDCSFGYLREDTPAKPATLYAACKHALHLAAEQIARLEGVRLAWGRVFFPYGPGEDPRRAVPALINSLLRGARFKATAGMQVRDYLHVDDVAAAFAMLTESAAEGAYNIASGEPVTIRALMEMVRAIVGASEPIEFGALPYRTWDPMFICGDSRRLQALAWRPARNLPDGLAATVRWWAERSGGNGTTAGTESG